jgi:hypothetical protein
VDEVSKLLNQNDIFAETAKKMEEQIRGRLKNGDDDKIAGAREFAQGVSQDLSSVSKDKQLGFAYAPDGNAIRGGRSRLFPGRVRGEKWKSGRIDRTLR